MFKSERLMDMYHSRHGMHMACMYIRMYIGNVVCTTVHGNTDMRTVPSLVHSNCVHGLLAPPWGMGCTSHCDGSALTTALTG